jgi:hypothetical protein
MAKKQEARNVTKAEVAKEVKAEAKQVEKAESKGKKAKFSPPPPPPISLNGVENPLIASRGLKRALTVAIVDLCRNKDGSVNENKAALLIRASGILFKAGYTNDEPTDELCTSEWSGKPYARFATNTTVGKVYAQKHPDKVERVMAFAKALVSSAEEEQQKKA